MIAAIGPDSHWAYYLTIGMVATVNPCGFAMLPAYLSYFLGLEGSEAAVPRASVGQAIRVSLAVAAGFMAVFAIAGVAVDLTSLPVYRGVPWISLVIGLALVVLGVAMLAGFELSVALPRLDRGGRERTVRSMFVFGVSYAIASIGCTLPLFLGVVAGTMRRESLVDGLVAFLIYGLGMTLILTALTVTIALARTSIVRFLRRSLPYITRISGALVAVAGAYVAYYGVIELRDHRAPGSVPASGITDRVSSWSSSITEWIDDVGSVRIAIVILAGLAVVLLAVRLGRPKADQGASRSTSQPEAAGAEPEPEPEGSRR
ncbi:MAG TPA: cytochrome c biogenesis CcdA family protein [Acidimicrobiales bacterium]|nr:cytochrome c biogenesis CcdA family protein [Acidimicrobiales bacterium]